MSVVDRPIDNRMMTFVNKNNSFEADRGYHDDMVMNCVLFAWFVTTDFFTNLTDTVKDLLYAEQQKMIEDDMLPLSEYLVNNNMMRFHLSTKTAIDGSLNHC